MLLFSIRRQRDKELAGNVWAFQIFKAIHLVLTYFSNNATPNTSQTVPLTGDLVVTIRSLWGSSHSNHHTSYRRQFGSQQTHRGLQTSLTPVHRIQIPVLACSDTNTCTVHIYIHKIKY